MADNVQLNQNETLGAIIATDNIDGVQHQQVKIEFGVDGTATPVSSSNPLPITGIIDTGLVQGLTNAELRASAIPVDTGLVQGITDSELRASPVNVNTGFVQGLTNTELRATPINVNNSKDAFGLLEVASPQVDFDAQLTYDEQPLLYERVLNGGTITYDGTDGVLVISNNSAVSTPFIQTFRYFPYRPGIGKKVFITFNFQGPVADNIKFAQFGDGLNSFTLRLLPNGTLEGFIQTETTEGNQSSDPVDVSGLGIDLNSEQICVIQFEALYVGSVQIGLQLGGGVVWVATFDNANNTTRPYIRTANLPVRVGIISTGTTPATMIFNCCSVQNSGGSEFVTGFDFTSFAEVTAGNNTPTHAISLRPKLLFKTRPNRVDFTDFSFEIAVRGNASIRWRLVIGQALTTPTYVDVNTEYSAMEIETNGTLSGTPALVITSGTVLATNQVKTFNYRQVPAKYPISLNAAGAHRDLGTLTLIVEGIGATSVCDVYMNHREVR